MAETKVKKEEKVEKKQSLYEKALEKLEKDYGQGIVMGAKQVPKYQEVISTGSLKIDRATKIWGIPNAGCVIEIIGWESSGKSTLTLYIIANAQKLTGKRALLIDGEHSFDPDYAASLGVDLDRLDVTQPASLEDSMNIAEELEKTGEYCIMVMDSHDSLKPKVIRDEKIGKSHLGVEARVMGDVVNRANSVAAKGRFPFIFISQLREKIGVMFGSPETTTGGNALKFFAHMRIEVRRSLDKEGEKEETIVVGNKMKAKVIKNKFAPPFGEAKDVYMEFGKGFLRNYELLDLGIDAGVIQQGGAWFTYEGTKIQGEDSFVQLLEDNPALAKEIEDKALTVLKATG